jgi:hypothetical protein
MVYRTDRIALDPSSPQILVIGHPGRHGPTQGIIDVKNLDELENQLGSGTPNL